MGTRRYWRPGIVCLAWAAAFAGLLFLSNNIYWSASRPGKPDGEFILFGDALLEPFGRRLWVSLKPLLLITWGATVWSLYRFVEVWRIGPVWRAVPPPGLCRVCGYDLRATPDRCPECGTAVAHPTP